MVCIAAFAAAEGWKKPVAIALTFMWLVENRRIDHTTFAKFRTRFHAPLRDLFRQIGRMAMNLGLIRLCEVAFDGTRVKANNNVIKLVRIIGRLRAAHG